MRLERMTRGSLDVIREEGERPIYKETAFFHALKKELLAAGVPCIKKLMHKDGHMVSEHQYYVRSQKKDWEWCLWFDSFALRDACEDYRKEGKVVLLVEEHGPGFPFQLAAVEERERETAKRDRQYMQAA